MTLLYILYETRQTLIDVQTKDHGCERVGEIDPRVLLDLPNMGRQNLNCSCALLQSGGIVSRA